MLHPQPAWSGVLTSSSSSSRLRLASTQQSSPGNNPLLAPNWQLKLGQLPLWDKIKPEHIQPAVATLIEEESASLDFLEQDLLAGNGAVSFDRIFKPLTQIQLRTDFVSGQFSHLSVSDWCCCLLDCSNVLVQPSSCCCHTAVVDTVWILCSICICVTWPASPCHLTLPVSGRIPLNTGCHEHRRAACSC